MANCLVAQSGGPTSAINASLAGVVRGAKNSKSFDKCLGALHGVQGLMNEEIKDLTDIDTKKLSLTPSMYLGSCRYKLPEYADAPEEYEKIFDILKKNDVDTFFYIGGNDSMDTVSKLSAYASAKDESIQFIGVPKTIDNDLCVTDHTPGYGSAAKFIATTLLEVSHDTAIYPIKSVTIVEIMGRDAGWLAGAAALARNDYNVVPHLIYLPEVAFNEDEFIEDVKDMIEKHGNVVVAVSEGIKDKDGVYITSSSATEDKFGHSQLSGTGKTLELLVKEKIGVKARAVEINIPQRTAGHMASLTDIEESIAQGEFAVEKAEEGMSGVMITIHRLSDIPYTTYLSTTDIDDTAGLIKHVPKKWINKRGNDVTDEFIQYVKPLIQGEVDLKYKDGLPDYMDISDLL